MARKTYDFVNALNDGQVENIVDVVDPALFVLDTGTIIDLENHYRKNKNNCRLPFELLDTLSMKYPLIITKGVLNEIREHNENMVINGCPEISSDTRNLVERLHKDSNEIISNSREGDEHFRELIRYQVYWAAKESCNGDYRKGIKDVMSSIDRNIIAEAFFLRGGEYAGEPIESLDILSTDGHVEKTVQTLGDPKYNFSGVRVLHTRKDFKRELNKIRI